MTVYEQWEPLCLLYCVNGDWKYWDQMVKLRSNTNPDSVTVLPISHLVCDVRKPSRITSPISKSVYWSSESQCILVFFSAVNYFLSGREPRLHRYMQEHPRATALLLVGTTLSASVVASSRGAKPQNMCERQTVATSLLYLTLSHVSLKVSIYEGRNKTWRGI